MPVATSGRGDASKDASADGDAEQLHVKRGDKEIRVPIREGAISASALGALGGLVLYDPGYQNTAVVRSAVSLVDGERGILQYRGYPIEQLAESASYPDVAHLLVYGELPAGRAAAAGPGGGWPGLLQQHAQLHTGLGAMLTAFDREGHPMGMFIAALAAMSAFHPEAQPALRGADLFVAGAGKPQGSVAAATEALMNRQILRLLGVAPTVAAAVQRHRMGLPPVLPRADLGYVANFLYMLDRPGADRYEPNPVLVRALEVLFILHAEHEMNCGTAVMRHIASARADPYVAVAGAAGALFGPLHGGANEAVLRMLADDIKDVESVPRFLERVKRKETRLMGFGHRIYRTYDPRARIVSRLAREVFAVCGEEPLIRVAVALEKAALADDYFSSRRLYPNVDFYSGLIYRAMGFPTDFIPVLFAIPRLAGWLAHWREAMRAGHDGAARIWRPRQLYIGPARRDLGSAPEEASEAEVPPSMRVPEQPLTRRYRLSKQ